VLQETSYLRRLKLIQFHMQYLWFYLSRLHEQVDRINRSFIDAASGDGDHGLHRSLAPLVMKIEMLNINNERFKVAIETEAESIYRHVQARWNVEGALRGMGHSLSFLKQHLADLAEERRARLSRRLNGLLVFISALQILGLISVWADYLNILSDKQLVHPFFRDNQMPDFQPLASHTIDIPFIFPRWHGGQLGVNIDHVTGQPRELNAQETALSDKLVAAWTKFAKYGNPNGSGNAPWPQFTTGSPDRLSENLSFSVLSESQYRTRNHCDFWDPTLTY